MKLSFQLLNNKKFVLDGVEATDTFLHVKQRIVDEQQLGKNASDIKLIMLAKILKDDATVGSFSIKENATIVCMISKIKGPAPATAPAAAAVTAADPQQPVVDAAAQPDVPAPAPETVAAVANRPLALVADAVLNPPAAHVVPRMFGQPARVPVVIDEAVVANLMALGFERGPVTAALQRAGGRSEIAAEILFAAQEHAMAQAPHPAVAMVQGGGGMMFDDNEEDDGNDEDDGDVGMDDGQGGGLHPDAAALLRQFLGQQPELINEMARQDPEFQALHRQNPQMMEAVLQAMGQPNMMAQMMQAMGGAGGGAVQVAQPLLPPIIHPGGENPPNAVAPQPVLNGDQFAAMLRAGFAGNRPQPVQVELTDVERDQLAMLSAMSGRPEAACLEAYLVCDRNFDHAANLLLEQA